MWKKPSYRNRFDFVLVVVVVHLHLQIYLHLHLLVLLLFFFHFSFFSSHSLWPQIFFLLLCSSRWSLLRRRFIGIAQKADENLASEPKLREFFPCLETRWSHRDIRDSCAAPSQSGEDCLRWTFPELCGASSWSFNRVRRTMTIASLEVYNYRGLNHTSPVTTTVNNDQAV